MLLKMFAIKDDAAQYHTSPFTARSESEALRMFTQSLVGEGTMAKFPGQFTLVYIGAYDDVSGSGTFLPVPEPVANGVEALAREKRASGALDS